jgi:hypothetical protein
MIKEGDYGLVLVELPNEKPRVGFYDDDEEGNGIVYFGRPLVDPYELIPRKHLKKALNPRLRDWLTERDSEFDL